MQARLGGATARGVVAGLAALGSAWPGPASRAAGDEAPRAPAPPRPNVVVLFADDLGWGEVGAGRTRDVPTPNIDAIAAAGVRFTQGYVSCPLSAPSRAGLLTGRYQQRFGLEHNPGPGGRADSDYGLPAGEATIAERLRAAGYATAMSGKWHLGYRPESRPPRRGFDEFFGFLGGAHAYVQGGRRAGDSILRGDEAVAEPAYLTDAIAREAASFVARNKARPFLLYVPFNAVHSPLEVTETYRARFDAVADPQRQVFAAMLSALDDGVGRVMGAVRDAGIEERTLVFFLSDNGGPTEQTSSSNGPLRGRKGTMFEGGVRVPFLVQWKGRLPAGRVEERPVISLDVVPTALAAAGAPADPKLDGVDLLPYLAGANDGRPHDALFWRMGRQSAARVGDLKMVRVDGRGASLFDLARDPAEATDLAASRPDDLRKVEAAWAAWDAANVPARWRRDGGADGRDE